MIFSKSCKHKDFKTNTITLLPHRFVMIGWVLVLTSFIAFILIKVNAWDPEPARVFVRTAMLSGLFMVASAREKEEDERTLFLRIQSFAWAFFVGILYSLVLPYVDFAIDAMIGKDTMIKDPTGFEALSMLLTLQIVFYQSLKLKS